MKRELADQLEKMGYQFPSDDESADLGFIDWFMQRLLGLDSEEYRRTFWREFYTTGHTIGPVPQTFDSFLRKHSLNSQGELGLAILIAMTMGVVFPFWLVCTQLHAYIKLCRRKRRRTYYEQETARRHALADQRRAITVRRTVNEKPTLASIRDAYAHVGDSPEAALRLGALLEDLECYVDNHAYTTRGVPGIRGRAGGIKRLFEREAPDLFLHYKAVMRYKALAKKFRQACDCLDPVPVGDLLPNRSAGASTQTIGDVAFPRRTCLRDTAALTNWMKNHGNTAFLQTQPWVRNPERVYTDRNLLRDDSLSLAAELLKSCDGTLISLEAAIALKIDPSCVGENFQPDTRVKILVPGQRAIQTPGRVQTWLERRKAKGTAA